MKSILAALALASASCFACWSSNEFGGTLVCGTPTDYHPATAEEIKQDQEYYAWKYGAYEKYGNDVVAHLEESLVGVDPVVADQIRKGWSTAQNKTDEKVAIYQEVQQGPAKP